MFPKASSHCNHCNYQPPIAKVHTGTAPVLALVYGMQRPITTYDTDQPAAMKSSKNPTISATYYYTEPSMPLFVNTVPYNKVWPRNVTIPPRLAADPIQSLLLPLSSQLQ